MYKLCIYRHYLCTLLPTIYSSTIYVINTTIHICWNLSLGCNCTAACAMLSFGENYKKPSWVIRTFYHRSPSISYCWQCSNTRIMKTLLSSHSCLKFPHDMCGRAGMLTWLLCNKELLDGPTWYLDSDRRDRRSVLVFRSIQLLREDRGSAVVKVLC